MEFEFKESTIKEKILNFLYHWHFWIIGIDWLGDVPVLEPDYGIDILKSYYGETPKLTFISIGYMSISIENEWLYNYLESKGY